MTLDKAILFEVLITNYPQKYRVKHKNISENEHVIILYVRKMFGFWKKADQLIMDCSIRGWFYEKGNGHRTVKG